MVLELWPLLIAQELGGFVYIYLCLVPHEILSPPNLYVVVRLEFVDRELTVLENEGEVRACVSISSVIARPLQFVLIHGSTTTGMSHAVLEITNPNCNIEVTTITICIVQS